MRCFRAILLFLLFVCIFLRYLYPAYTGRDTDIFWHIKTGEVIFQDQRIPSSDPFAYTPPDQEREQVLLKSYWLADLLFYGVYKTGGFLGLVLLRSLLLCLIVFIVYLSIRKRGFGPSILLSLSLGLVLMPTSTLRPNLFSFLFAAVMIFLMEQYRGDQKRTYQILVFVVMLFWTNMHGGFLIGAGILGLYAATAALLFLLRGNKKEQVHQTLAICLTAGLGIGATVISPLGIMPLLSAVKRFIEPSHKLLASHIETEMGLFKNIVQHPNEMIFLSLFLTGVIMIYTALNLTRKKAGLTETAIVLSLFFLTIYSVRVMPIFLSAGLIISVGRGDYRIFPFQPNRWHQAGSMAAIASLLIFFTWNSLPKTHPGKLVETDTIYLKLGDFLEKNTVQGNMLNREFTGNYLIFRLYPQYKVFTDSRYLNIDVFFDGLDMFYAVKEHSDQKDSQYMNSVVETCLQGLQAKDNRDYSGEYWSRLLEKYQIDFIAGRISQPGTGQLFPIFLKLIHNDAWKLIYRDGNTVVMVKDNLKNKAILKQFPPQDKQLLYEQAILENIDQVSPGALETLGYASLMRGDRERATMFAKNALYLDRNLQVAQACLEYAKPDH